MWPLLRRGVLALSVALMLVPERPAFGGSFDAAGVYQPDPEALVLDDFESYPVDEHGTAGEEGTGSSEGEPNYPYQLVEDATALTGTRVFKLDPWQSAAVSFSLPNEDGSYIARVWVKGEAMVTVKVEYNEGGTPGLTQLLPTGRVTSDNWFELESSPFSVTAAGNSRVRLGFFSPTGVVADAFEVVRGGEYRPLRGCTGVNDTTSCLPDEICMHRRCVDARGLVPPIPKDPAERTALADYMGNRIKFLFGPLLNRERNLNSAMVALDAMRSAEDRYRFWFSFVTALQRLQDSHSSAYGLIHFGFDDFPGSIPFGACFVGGDADLTHEQVPRDQELPDVLVSHIGGNTWGLKAGDRLVAIDGEHPITWAKKLEGRSWHAEQVNDPASVAQHIESLRQKIPMLAYTITVIRCHGGSNCGSPETLIVAEQKPDELPLPHVACDNRPRNHFPGQPEDHNLGGSVFFGTVSESNEVERIQGMAWNSLYGAGSFTAMQIEDAVRSFRESKARGVILDHRTGNGGTKDAAMPILGFVSPPKYSEVGVWRVFLDDMGPKDIAEGLALFDKIKDDPFHIVQVGSTDAVLDVPVALLLTRDVSASDYFPNAFKGSPKARIFGPHPTNGAFSTFLDLSYWLSLSFHLAAHDTLNHDGTMLCARGVVPDEIVEPRQSDLVQGIDTVYEAALSWVRANLKPQETP
ncbi:MAG: S41 family peptidase [Myxococcales bacterium]|nr:S41 family peptidase [Polyangiaceae bacterium]MDW8248946.1 S41 family peptidase [Myxococcales bacterium]